MNSRPLLIVISTLAALGMEPPAWAADQFWTNSLGGSFQTAANWSPNGVPDPTDNVNFTNNATYAVTWSDARTNANAFFNARSGTVTQALGGFSWLLTNSWVVGRNAGATAAVTHVTGTLRVTNSAGSGQLIIGQNGRGTFRLAGGTAMVETDHLVATNNSASLVNSVFTFANGTLTTLGNGQINQSASLTIGSVAGASATWNMFGGTNTHDLAGVFSVNLGSAAGTGAVTVAGPTTVWTNNGQLTVGASGRGLLLISNGAVVYSRTTAIGSAAAASNSVARVTGNGTQWRVNGGLVIGNVSAGNQFLVEEGGVVADTTGAANVDLGLSSASSSNNLAWVSGTNSLWSMGGGLDIGNVSPANCVIVSNGGMIAASSATLSASPSVQNNRLTVTGAGSLFTNLGTLQLGPGAANTLSVRDGGRLDTGWCVLGEGDAAYNNLAVVEGPGSRLCVRATTVPTLTVGDESPNNTLLVTNGGVVEAYAARIGEAATSTNNIVVVSDGAFWTNTSGVILGVSAPRNGVELRSGAVAVCDDFLMGANPTSTNNTLVLTDAGTKLVVNDSFNLGDSATGQRLWVTNGATLFSGTASIGSFSSFPGNEVIVAGTNSLWLNASNNWFMLGSDGAFQKMSVLAGGAVENRSLLFVGRSSTGRTNTLLLAGPGTLWSNRTSVYIGEQGAGNLLVISNAARMTAESSVIGGSAGAEGNTALVTGAGSMWTNRNQLYVGVGGSHSLLVVSNGGWVVGEVGTVGGVNGLAWITDASSMWSNSSALGLVDSGNRLVVTNGALAAAGTSVNLGFAAGWTNNEILVSGNGSRLVSGRDLEIGVGGNDNRLIVADGALASCVTGYVGSASSGNLALITGPGSRWSNSACLTLGAFDGDFNTIVVSNGATIAAPLVKVGEHPSSVVNELIVAGGNLVGTAPNGEIGSLIIGLSFSGALTLNQGIVTANRLVITNGQFNQLHLNAGVLNVRTLVVNNTQTFFAGSGSEVAVLNLLGGVHTFANGLTIRSNASLTGTGAISGTLTVQTGGTLAPGASAGRVTLFSPPVLQGLAQMEVSKNGATLTNDQVQVTTAITYGGALAVAKIGPTALTSGNQFPLFSATSYGGAFSSLTLPALDAGMMWTNKLLINGSLQVVPFTPPVINWVTQSGTNLVFTITGGSPSGGYAMLTSTDVALPLTNWTTNSAGNFNWLGTGILTNAIDPATPQRFYRLATFVP